MTKPEITIQMRRVSDAMKELASEMIAYGADCDDVNMHSNGRKLLCAGLTLSQLQSDAEKEGNSI